MTREEIRLEHIREMAKIQRGSMILFVVTVVFCISLVVVVFWIGVSNE